MAHRYFTSEIQGDQAFLRGQEANHLARVLRAQPGQQVLLCDGRGTDYQAEILAADPAEISLRILESHPSDSEPGVAVTLYVGYPKQDKLEWIIQKGVELGAARIVPFFCRSCVAKPKKEEDKNQRYQRIALEAAKQSGRGVIPQVAPLLDFPAALAEMARAACPRSARVAGSFSGRRATERVPLVSITA